MTPFFVLKNFIHYFQADNVMKTLISNTMEEDLFNWAGISTTPPSVTIITETNKYCFKTQTSSSITQQLHGPVQCGFG